MGWPSASALRVTTEEMATAWNSTKPELQGCAEGCGGAGPRVCGGATAGFVGCREMCLDNDGTDGEAAGAVGCYVPSGRHPLPSTLLMTAIPAQVAGVERIVVVSPKPAPLTLAAAHMLGITEFYRLGGAHSIAALAYGTATIERVDKIVGPGNLYVTAAKRLVAFDCAIDMLAGPTEIVVTSERGRAEDIAADLVAQAEHDPETLAIFITKNAELAKAVAAAAKRLSAKNPVARDFSC